LTSIKQGRRQKIFQGGEQQKNRPKVSKKWAFWGLAGGGGGAMENKTEK